MSQDLILEKYAESAAYLLQEAYPSGWTNEEAVKLAQELIELDLEKSAEFDKLAQWDEEGRIVARAFYNEIDKQAAGVRNAVFGWIKGKGAALAAAGRNRIPKGALPGTEATTIGKAMQGVGGFIEQSPKMTAALGAAAVTAVPLSYAAGKAMSPRRRY